MLCKNCGKELSANETVCSACETSDQVKNVRNLSVQINRVKQSSEKTTNLLPCFLFVLPAIATVIASELIGIIVELNVLLNENYLLYVSLTNLIPNLIRAAVTVLCSLSCNENHKKLIFIASSYLGGGFCAAVSYIIPLIISFFIKEYSSTMVGIVFSVVEIVGVILHIAFSVVIYIMFEKLEPKVNETESEGNENSEPQAIYDENGEVIYVNVPESTKSSRSRAVTALLCFSLGVLGIHRLYAGKVGTGLIWMFTGGLFGIGTFIDFFMIICGGFKDNEGKNI